MFWYVAIMFVNVCVPDCWMECSVLCGQKRPPGHHKTTHWSWSQCPSERSGMEYVELFSLPSVIVFVCSS